MSSLVKVITDILKLNPNRAHKGTRIAEISIGAINTIGRIIPSSVYVGVITLIQQIIDI